MPPCAKSALAAPDRSPRAVAAATEFGTELAEIVLADAVPDRSLRTPLQWSEEQVVEDDGAPFGGETVAPR
jgi:hypothetical protein